MPRTVVLRTHRYLGIGVGWLMLMWCLSGMVMMYVGYPALSESDRVRHLEPIAWPACCASLGAESAADSRRLDGLQIEMVAGTPVLRLFGGAPARLIDLATGSEVPRVSQVQASAVAGRYAGATAGRAPRRMDSAGRDQWTVSGDFDAQRPLYRFALDDADATELYVSASSGRAVQITTGRERFWNWLGAVPHWLYFTGLRRHGLLWSEVVIAAAVIGCFLVTVGVYIGVLQWRRQPQGSASPYHGLNRWHHLAGLLFGVLTLSWVASGLLSMNPWGWLESRGFEAERRLLRNDPGIDARRLDLVLRRFSAARLPQVVSIEGSALDGVWYFVATSADGVRRRFDADAQAAPLRAADWRRATEVLDRSAHPAAPQLLTREDNYYFAHHGSKAPLPVVRWILADGTRYYADVVSGALLAKMDGSAKAYRWLQQAPHRMDFTPAMRGRPQWDALMWILLSGVTLLCGTGTLLGVRRVLRRTAPPEGPPAARP